MSPVPKPRPFRAALLTLALLAPALLAPAGARAEAPGFLAPPGPAGADWPEPKRPAASVVSDGFVPEDVRDRADEAGQVARGLGLRPGMRVADIGAGGGYLTVRLAKAVGPEGRVVAQDVTPAYLAGLADRVRGTGLTNVDLGLGEPDDPRLPPASLDAAVLGHMYHEIARPMAFLANLAAAMKPGALVAITDIDGPIRGHGTPKALLACELAAAGYRARGSSEMGAGLGYLAVFAAPASPAKADPAALAACG